MQTHIEIELIGLSNDLEGIEQYLMVKYDKPAKRTVVNAGMHLIFEDVGLEMIRSLATTAYHHKNFKSIRVFNDPKAVTYY